MLRVSLQATSGSEVVNAPTGVQSHANFRERLLHRPDFFLGGKILGKVGTSCNDILSPTVFRICSQVKKYKII